MTPAPRPVPRIAVPVALDPAAFQEWDRGAQTVSLGGETMGTGWRVHFARPRDLDPEALGAAIQTRLDALVGEMSHWAADSHLSRFNAGAAGTWMTLPPDFATVMATGLAIARRSDGAFDPTIGALVDLWGYGATPAPHAPDGAAIRDALASGGWHRLRYEALPRRLCQPGGLRLDFSGIAKGHAVDRIADLLADRGVRHALVEIGGELVGRGLRPDGDPWWVDLETPDDRFAPLRVALHQLAVATSGDYVRGRHTIDPRTGRPVAHAMSVSVLHSSAMHADAWATALGVAQPEDARVLAIREGLAARFLWRTPGEPIEWISPALHTMLA